MIVSVYLGNFLEELKKKPKRTGCRMENFTPIAILFTSYFIFFEEQCNRSVFDYIYVLKRNSKEFIKNLK